MTSSIGAALALVTVVASARAQGTLSLCTACSSLKPRIKLNGLNVATSDNVWVEVLVAGANGLVHGGEPLQPFELTSPSASLGGGLISKGTVSVEGIPGGNAVEVTVRAWDKDTGNDYDLATVRDSTTFTMTLGGIFDANGIQGLPNPIASSGFTGLRLVSVPSLTVERSKGGKVRLAWRIRADGFELQGKDTLGGDWMPVEFTQTFDGGYIVAEVDDEGEHRFYRLAKP